MCIVGKHNGADLRVGDIIRALRRLPHRARVAKGEARRIWAVACIIKFPFNCRRQRLIRRGRIMVERHAVGVYHRRHIGDGFHPPLDLQAAGPRADDLFQMCDQVHIPRVEDIRSERILLHAKVFPIPAAFPEFICPAAGLRAFAPVRVTPRNIVAEQTPAGIGNAHCTVHENLKLQRVRQRSAHRPDFCK